MNYSVLGEKENAGTSGQCITCQIPCGELFSNITTSSCHPEHDDLQKELSSVSPNSSSDLIRGTVFSNIWLSNTALDPVPDDRCLFSWFICLPMVHLPFSDGVSGGLVYISRSMNKSFFTQDLTCSRSAYIPLSRFQKNSFQFIYSRF